MRNPNNCSTCKHSKNPDGGHCYMFRDEPTEVCMQHTLRKGVLVLAGEGMSMAILASQLLNIPETEKGSGHE